MQELLEKVCILEKKVKEIEEKLEEKDKIEELEKKLNKVEENIQKQDMERSCVLM